MITLIRKSYGRAVCRGRLSDDGGGFLTVAHEYLRRSLASVSSLFCPLLQALRKAHANDYYTLRKTFRVDQ